MIESFFLRKRLWTLWDKKQATWRHHRGTQWLVACSWHAALWILRDTGLEYTKDPYGEVLCSWSSDHPWNLVPLPLRAHWLSDKVPKSTLLLFPQWNWKTPSKIYYSLILERVRCLLKTLGLRSWHITITPLAGLSWDHGQFSLLWLPGRSVATRRQAGPAAAQKCSLWASNSQGQCEGVLRQILLRSHWKQTLQVSPQNSKIRVCI